MSAALAGRRAIITGAGSGIGAATANTMAAAGARVAALVRTMPPDAEPAIPVAGLAYFAADLGNAAAISGVVADAVAWLGGVDLLVHAAGRMFVAPFDQSLRDEWEEMAAVNLMAPMQITQLCLPELRRADHSDVMLIASVSGKIPAPMFAAYSATKAALIMFAEILRQEEANTSVKVTTINPGVTATRIGRSITLPDVQVQLGAAMAGITPMQPQDVADMVAALAALPAHVAGNSIDLRPARQAL